ncbi:hypothetical protein TNCV_3247631 [Trichonephila clavipes]|nr:hypothetical protein TNCV_3247631 [Trichonephila clavipes]
MHTPTTGEFYEARGIYYEQACTDNGDSNPLLTDCEIITPRSYNPVDSSSNDGRSNLVVQVTDSWPACHEFKPSTAEDPSFRGAMHLKSVESSNALHLVWCGI